MTQTIQTSALFLLCAVSTQDADNLLTDGLAVPLTAERLGRIRRVQQTAETLNLAGERVFGTDISDGQVRATPFIPVDGAVEPHRVYGCPRYRPLPGYGSALLTTTDPEPDSAHWREHGNRIQLGGLRIDAESVFLTGSNRYSGVKLMSQPVAIADLYAALGLESEF